MVPRLELMLTVKIPMTSQATIVGIYVGLGLAALHLLLHLRLKIRPSFNNFATIILATVGALVGAYFGYLALTAAASDLGKLEDQRLPMVLGAGAVVWLAIEQLGKLFLPLVLRQRPKAAVKTIQRADADGAPAAADRQDH